MRFSAIALLAGASTAAAQTINTASLYGVLATALPQSLLQEALTNSGAVISQISSQFAAGQTPTWFSALPTDVKSYLLSQGTAMASMTSAMGSSASATASMTMSMPMSTSTMMMSSSMTTSRSVASQTGAAAIPTAFVGSGLAFGAGLAALLAL